MTPFSVPNLSDRELGGSFVHFRDVSWGLKLQGKAEF